MSTRWTIEDALERKPPLLHPLAGARPSILLEKITGNGPLTPRTRLQRIATIAAMLTRQPFSRYQALHWSNRLDEERIKTGPVFIVGHWRSGTTLLHNIMSQDPLFGCLSFLHAVTPAEILIERRLPIIRNILGRLLPEKRGTDNVALGVDTPQEEEWALANLGPLSFFNAYYFPQHYRSHFERSVLLENTTAAERDALGGAYQYLAKSLQIRHGGKTLLFKNPSATARMPLLKKTFPTARFIHIVRNPYDVFISSLARFPRIFSALAWERFDDLDFEAIVLESYEALMKRYLEDREQIPPGDLVETSYEKLVANPVGEVERIYDTFNLPIDIASFEQIDNYIASLRGYKKKHPPPRQRSGRSHQKPLGLRPQRVALRPPRSQNHRLN